MTPLSALLLLPALGLAPTSAQANDGAALTFHRDIAPIVFARCATCHHPGESAPFSLLSYDDVKKRARQIAIVVESEYMPPWLPDAEHGVFAGDRSLAAEERARLLRWIGAGAVAGDPDDAPPQPTWNSGWELGEPDLVAAMDASFELEAEGRDVYRNFVIRAPLEDSERERFVRAVELRPDNRAVVHHAVMFVDGSGIARQLDRAHAGVGYPDMGLGAVRIPDGQFIGWTPGRTPSPGSDDISWRLDPYTDIVLQLHMRPTGKRERVRVEVGLHFADAPPTKHPMGIRLASSEIDIPAGDAHYVVESSYTLPVDVRVLGIYPHAHYLGKDMLGYATLPDGTRRELIHIPSWDFNWQEEFAYEAPLELPAGTVLGMRYVYDNSSANVLNPNDPPARVVFGAQSTDEMAELLLSVLPADEDRPLLWRDFTRNEFRGEFERIERVAAADPENPAYYKTLATHCQRLGRHDEAVAYYERLVARTPGRANPLQRLGQARLAAGDLDGAIRDLKATLALSPNHPRALVYLGNAYAQSERLDEAAELLERAVSLEPTNPLHLTSLGEVRLARGELDQAEAAFVGALRLNPERTRALWNLAAARLEQGRLDDAERFGREALHIAPDSAAAHAILGRVFEARGDVERAAERFRIAHRLEPQSADFEADLARARARTED